jgi:hypothetical protein
VRDRRKKFDGSGHPNKLRGEAIHIYTRIVAAADAFDAIRSHRPCAGQSYERAREGILAHSDSHFDPGVVSAFMSISREEWERASMRTVDRPPRDQQLHSLVEVTGQADARAGSPVRLGGDCYTNLVPHSPQ